MTDAIARYREVFEKDLASSPALGQPNGLYEPIEYIMNLGGKRMRPILALMSADLYGAPLEQALPAARAVEIFHNFSLIHDDIMDQAPLRRGKPTVHQKWDLNTGILSGDAMLIYAYQCLEAYEPEQFKPMMALFSRTARQVCEGQQYDMDFENQEGTTIPDYLKMIEYKTAVLLGCALQLGAMAAKAPVEEQQALYAFGIYLGMAFQLQDDYLDAFGDPKSFGKQVGGDIIENKKTFLYLKAMESGSSTVQQELRDLYSIRPKNPESKVVRVKKLFKQTGANTQTRAQIVGYTEEAFRQLEYLGKDSPAAEALREFGNWLLKREF